MSDAALMDDVPPDLAVLQLKARKLAEDLAYYSQCTLKIRTKAGSLEPLILNRVQLYVHERLEEQRRICGKVRALILKCRQPGVSTYVEARYFRRITRDKGLRGFILTHAEAATNNLFAMFERFHENLPEPLRLPLSAANAREIVFAGLDSGIMVSTAGARGAGRAQTLQLFHGSEVAHWQNAAEHAGGVLQAIPDAPGTEAILESTGNGVGGLFYDMCQAAERGESEYTLIFVPWFWHDEYRADAPEGWEPPAAFREYRDAHRLDAAQIYWFWRKNSELAQACGAGPDEIAWLTRQEYPATTTEAFQTSGHESFIKGETVLRARKFTSPDQPHAPLILGVDIARGGRDKSRIVDRQGRSAGYRCNVTLDTNDLMEVVGRVGREIDRLNPAMTFIDVTGLGAGVYDRLKERGYRNTIAAVNFGSKARDDNKYANKRAEMWGRMQEWLADPGGVDIPDRDEWQASLCAPGYGFDSNSRLQLEKKEDIRKRVGFSPDLGDALALTFAETVRNPSDVNRPRPTRANVGSSYRPLRWGAGR